ncbi:MAG: class I tRNA ligase family protein, partial [Minisyncoccia bacterium]
WINGPIEATIIKDEIIDMEFGTGVMTITPWHSHEDFALAEKYKLDKEQIIDSYGRLLPIAGEFAGMKITEARDKIVEKLKDKGLLVSIDENYTNRVATAQRSGGTIEPQIMLQWFVDVNKKIAERGNKSLKELMLEPVRNGEIKIIPEHFEKVYFNWIENLRDWCISRQIWYGHRIPVWYKDNEVYCGLEAPKEAGWIQDEDTLDTWFSSGLWTFSTLGWPNVDASDLKRFHPTSVINPGYEILFFWVARMILMSQYLIGEIPFKTIYLHGMLRDQKGQKFSKSLDNGVDPLEIINEYGADALRMSMIVGIGPGADSKFDIQKVKAYGKFSNKIWNIARFVFSQKNEGELNQTLVDEFNALAADITLDMESYRFYLAAEKIYAYIWHRFADEIIEESKGKPEYGTTLYYILENSLKLLHPFMPFVTEEIWQNRPNNDSKTFLLVEKWPVKN